MIYKNKILIDPLYWQYLYVPWPTYLDLNACSYECAYCWANLDGRRLELDLQAVQKQIRNLGGINEIGEGIAAHFLESGYPVSLSPTSDPFAPSNEQAFVFLRELFKEAEIPLVLETRGGRLAGAAIETMAPTHLSIPLTTDRAEIKNRFEPGSPGLEERLELAVAAKAKGHVVEIGLNPLVPAWWNDLPGLLARLRKLGFNRLLIQELNLSLRQRQWVKVADEEFLQYAMMSEKPDWRKIWQIRQQAEAMGFMLDPFYGSAYLGHGQPYFGEYFALGGKWFPTVQEFFWRLGQEAQHLGKPMVYSVDDFSHWAGLDLDFESPSFGNYLSGWNREFRRSGKGPTAYSFREVHAHLFDIFDARTPFWADETSIVTEQGVPVLDEEGSLLLAFDPFTLRKDKTELKEAARTRLGQPKAPAGRGVLG